VTMTNYLPSKADQWVADRVSELRTQGLTADQARLEARYEWLDANAPAGPSDDEYNDE
jgi:hypothetical protein